MLEAYLRQKNLDALEARLPEHVDEVITDLNRLAGEDPVNTRCLSLLSRCHFLKGDMEQAKLTLEKLLTRDPGDVPARVELAKLFHDQGNLKAAIKHLNEATSARPEIAQNWKLLSEYLEQDQRQQESKNVLTQFELIKAFNDNLAVAEKAIANAEYARAESLCRQLLKQVPNEVRVLRLLARLAKHFRHFEISTSILARCAETQPDNAPLGLEYAYSLLSNKMFKEALAKCGQLIELAPEDIEIYDVKAGALVALGRYEEAIVIYRELIDVHEQPALCFLRLGNVLKTTGETTEAISCYQRAIALEPTLGEAYWNLANLKTYVFSAEETTSMQQLIEGKEISAMDSVLMSFALGKAMEDAQQFGRSFKYYQSANEGYAKIRPYRYSNLNMSLKSFFTTDYFSDKKDCGLDSDAPIFVVGIPRSGSTLVEQILGSHSLVDATRELTEMVSIARKLNNTNQPGLGKYPQSLASLNQDDIRGFAQGYLSHAQDFRQQAPYFVDKAPGNFHHIGLIKTLFPQAKIIDVRRNPMASGWSLYKHFFAEGSQFCYDLANIGKYYNDYIDLMNHWHTVLPGQILTISYEDLVTDLSGNVERILRFCGLEFERACVDFHLNKRAVATPSSEQVRQPIYSDALDHWKNYEEFLSPLKQIVKT